MGLDCRTILPHPLSLSRWERETAIVRLSLCKYLPANPVARIFKSLNAILPLPAGEGRGEGESSENQ